MNNVDWDVYLAFGLGRIEFHWQPREARAIVKAFRQI